MLVHGAIIPPRSVLEAVAAVVLAVPEPVQTVASLAPAPAPKGLLSRVGRHRTPAEPAPAAVAVAVAAPMLEHISVERMQLPITGFGNLTTNDVHRLVETLREAAAGWAPATVRFSGGTALDFPGDWSVWAKLDGDLDALMAAARGVPQSVERLGYFVDRRQFRPTLSVAAVTPATTGPFLEELVGALDAFRGEEWTPEIVLTKETFAADGAETVPFERIPLGS